jgi:peptide/nickel transport system substrate-binding protein
MAQQWHGPCVQTGHYCSARGARRCRCRHPEYYFYRNFHGNNSIFNISSYQNKEMDALIDKSRFTTDAAEYERCVKAFIGLCIRKVPVIPLNQPMPDVATQKNISGYTVCFHREPDSRQFVKG